MEDISDIKYQLHHILLDQYLIQLNMIKDSDIYVRNNVSLLQFL